MLIKDSATLINPDRFPVKSCILEESNDGGLGKGLFQRKYQRVMVPSGWMCKYTYSLLNTTLSTISIEQRNKGKQVIIPVSTLRNVLFIIFNLVSGEQATLPNSQTEHAEQSLIKEAPPDSSTASPEPWCWIPNPTAATNG